MSNAILDYLNSFSESEWLTAVDSLLPSIHEVDRIAVQVWFRFYPLSLFQFIGSADDKTETIKQLAIQGDFGLDGKIDTSHKFLYGHRYWPEVKSAVLDRVGDDKIKPNDLISEIKYIATDVSDRTRADRPLTLGIAAVGLMTFRQVAADAFKSASGEIEKPTGLMTRSPDAIVAARAKDDSQGLFGFLKTIDKTFSVIYDENTSKGRFEIINEQEIASASAKDRSQDWQSRDERCWEGPVPVECTAASCGTCWIGVIAGQEKLSDVSPRERRVMKLFGYNQPEDGRPFIRLACQARATGNTTIVIPSWNGVFGKKVYGNVDDIELEPATTSAKKLREVISSAATEG